MVPARIENSLRVELDGEGDSAIGLAICCHDGLASFDQADCDLLGVLIPHLRRAMVIHKRFALLDFSQRAALEALDRIATGIVLLDDGGAVKFANHLARDIAGSGDGFLIMQNSVLLDAPNI